LAVLALHAGGVLDQRCRLPVPSRCLATTLLLLFAAWRFWQRSAAVQGSDAFIARFGAAVHGLAAVATVAISLPIFAYPPCV